MKAKYATAIRAGIESANTTKFGSEEDPHWQLLEWHVWDDIMKTFHTIETYPDLVLKAYQRRHDQLITQARNTVSGEEFERMWEVYVKTGELHSETPTQKQTRMIQELQDEVTELKRRLECNTLNT